MGSKAATNPERLDLARLRRDLHRSPELSGTEVQTAARTAALLESLGADDVRTGIGGHGVVATFGRGPSGPCVGIRAELDALPIQESSGAPHSSTVPGVAHLCGHDGHMTMVLGAAERIATRPLERGRLVVVLQPAEETGAGAAAMSADRRGPWDELDVLFALHNLPGTPLGSVSIRKGTFNCASRGFECVLEGRTSHAAHPEDGVSPASAMCDLTQALATVDGFSTTPRSGFALSTVVHARLGEVAFGTSPGAARVMATIRAEHEHEMEQLARDATQLAQDVAARHGLGLRVRWHDVFRASVNDANAADLVRRSAEEVGAAAIDLPAAMPWSEDFGALAPHVPRAMFGLGSGENQPPLHAPDYDFPDALIDRGVDLLESIVRRAAARSPG